MRNKYPGYCYKCGKFVDKGQGHFERYRQNNVSRWRVQCAIHPIEEKCPQKLEIWKEKELEYERQRDTVQTSNSQ